MSTEKNTRVLMQAPIVVTILNLGVTAATTPPPSKWEFDNHGQVLTSMPYAVITIDPYTS